MPKKLRLIITVNFTLICFLTTILLAPSIVKAESWGYSGISPFTSETIVNAHSNTNVLYATARDGDNRELFKSINGGSSWFSIHQGLPIGLNHDVNSIGVSFTNSNIIYVGIYDVGVYKSTNGGKTWFNVGLNNQFIRSLAVDPKDHSIVYTGTGSNNFDGGVYKSSNGGSSWAKMSTGIGNPNIMSISISRLNSNIVFAGGGPGLWKSINGGNTWFQINNSDLNGTVIIHPSNSNIVYSNDSSGISKSTNLGVTWEKLNLASNQAGLIAHSIAIDQNNTNTIIVSSRSPVPGLFKSKDGGVLWEEISDGLPGNLIWAATIGPSHKTYVNVQGMGIWATGIGNQPSPTPTPSNSGGEPTTAPTTAPAATPTPIPSVPSDPTPTQPPTFTPTPPPKPIIVFIPGHGGSWNTKKFLYEIDNESDWQMAPMVHIYDNLIQTITNSGYSNGQDFFVFHYDWRKNTAESAERLKNKIGEYLAGKPSGTKVNIVAHSYGGLVGRYYLQNNSGSPIDKFLTVGTPHLGLADTYGPWEGGEVWKNDFWQWLAFETLLRYYQTRDKIISARETAWKVAPGMKDLLPSFEFLKKNGSFIGVSSMKQKNDFLLSNPFGPPFGGSDFSNLAGTDKNTLKEISVVERRWYDKIMGDWEDGLPVGFDHSGNGDGAVLGFSSEIAPEVYELSQYHSEIVSSGESLEIIKNILGLTGGTAQNAQNPKDGLVFALHSPATLRITSPDGNYQIGDSISLPQIPNSQVLDDNKMIFIEDPAPGTYNVEIIGYEQAEYSLDVLRIRDNQPALTQTFKSSTYPGNIQLLYYDFEAVPKESPLKSAEVVQETANFEDDLRLLQFDLLFAPGAGQRSPANRQMLVMLNTTYSHRLQNAKNLIAKNQKLKALAELQSAYNTLNNALILAARQRGAGLLSEDSALIYSQKIMDLSRKLQLFYVHLAQDINFTANKSSVESQVAANGRLIDNLDKRLSTKTNYLTAFLFKEAVKEKAFSEDALNRGFYNSALLQTQLALILAQSASLLP